MRLLPALVLALALVAGAAHADDVAEARKLLAAGDREAALKRVDQALAAKPGDQQARFLKGVILAEDGKTVDAIEIYERLTQDYPELPEAHNNLAALYAARGELDRARVSLEMAIRTNPGFATAYENLGDVYVQLAARAYERAVLIDAGNRRAGNKLAVARDLTKPKPKPEPPAKP
jgi:Flp pilus assembly protein TadD